MRLNSHIYGKNFGFVSTRFGGTDGVSLESAKWAEILWRFKHVSYWYAGQCDRNPGVSMVVPKAYFDHKSNRSINDEIFGVHKRSRECSERIHTMRAFLKKTLYEFIDKFKIDVLVAENCLTIPMHIPLGLALTELISETSIPTIAHHHDFYWERSRFAINSIEEYLEMAFPPRLPSIQHAVINTAAMETLAFRTGIPSTVIPNIIDFTSPPPDIDAYSSSFREDIGLKPDDVLILQPTRVISRKGIEHSIELVRRLGDPKYKLVISHPSGDEGLEYQDFLLEYAAEQGVDMRVVSAKVSEKRAKDSEGRKTYSLWDVYPHADLVTYPSTYEGFGNAFLEAVYFRKPLLVNRYFIYIRDIEPKGFNCIEMDGYVTTAVVEETRKVLNDHDYRKRMVNRNFEIGKRYYSKDVLERHLCYLISNIEGLNNPNS